MPRVSWWRWLYSSSGLSAINGALGASMAGRSSLADEKLVAHGGGRKRSTLALAHRVAAHWGSVGRSEGAPPRLSVQMGGEVRRRE